MPHEHKYGPLTPAQQTLVEDNIRLAHTYVLRMGFNKGQDRYQDLLQLACIGLCKAARKYDPAKGKFSTLAFWAMRHEMQLEWRRTKSVMTHEKVESLVINDLVGRTDDSEDVSWQPEDVEAGEFADTIVDRMAAQHTLDRVRQVICTLGERHQNVMNAWFELAASGQVPSQMDLHRMTGIPQPTVSRALMRVAEIIADQDSWHEAIGG
jgi:RNA polymerase sigma factor (sigma-70 family)